jgi:hypothetical protein
MKCYQGRVVVFDEQPEAIEGLLENPRASFLSSDQNFPPRHSRNMSAPSSRYFRPLISPTRARAYRTCRPDAARVLKHRVMQKARKAGS